MWLELFLQPWGSVHIKQPLSPPSAPLAITILLFVLIHLTSFAASCNWNHTLFALSATGLFHFP